MFKSSDAAWRLEYVDACYAATLANDASALSPALSMVAGRVGAAMALLQVMQPGGPVVEGIASWGFPDGMLEDYGAHFAADDPWLRLFLSHRLHWGQAASTGEEIDISPVINTGYYNEFWRRWGLLHTSGTFAELASGGVLNLGLPRFADAGTLQRSHQDDLAFATSHLVRVVSIQQRLGALQADNERRQSILDRLDFGVVLIDGKGRINLINLNAEGLIGNGGPLRSNGGALGFRDDDTEQRLRRQLELSPLHRRIRSRAAPDPFVVSAINGRRWMVFVLPWHCTTSDQWALLFFDEKAPQPDATAALAVLGALTTAETGVLQRMLLGLNSSEIARQRGTSPETVRSQIKSIMQKLEVHGQSELLRLASRYRPPLTADDAEPMG